MIKRLFITIILLLYASLAIALNANPAEKIWNRDELFKVPQYRKVDSSDSQVDGFRSLLFKGLPLRDGSQTEVFAYYGVPKTPRPANGYPALLLLHGGGGTAYTKYAREYLDRGYVVLVPDQYGKRPLAVNPKKRVKLEQGSTEDWQKRCVANAVLAHSLLRSMPDVNQKQTAIIGLSWGGVFALLTAAIDDRFRFATIIYSCGFWKKSQNNSVNFTWYDPSNFIPFVKIPIYWVGGTDDKSFPFESWIKSVELCPRTKATMLYPKLGHSHRGFETPVLFHIVDYELKGKKTLPEPGKMERKDDMVYVTNLSPEIPVPEPRLYYTSDSDFSQWKKWRWNYVSGIEKSGIYEFKIPSNACHYFVNFLISKECGFSTIERRK